MNGEDLEVVSAEVVERGPVSSQDRGGTEGPGELKFYGRPTTPTRSTPRASRSSLPGRTRPRRDGEEEGGQGVQEVGLRTLEGREGPRSEVVDRVPVLCSEEDLRREGRSDQSLSPGPRGQAEWAYSWMVHLASPIVGRFPGVEVEG